MERQIILYFAIGAVLATAAGAFMTAVVYDDHRMDGLGKFLCFMTLFLWPGALLTLAMFGVVAVCCDIYDWMDEHEFCPMTWLFAWPWKLCELWLDHRHNRIGKEIRKGDSAP